MKDFLDNAKDYYDFAQFIEQQNLVKDSAWVQKQCYTVPNRPHTLKCVLNFKTKNGKGIKLVDNPALGETHNSYQYREIIKIKNDSFFLYRHYLVEGAFYDLINMQTGKKMPPKRHPPMNGIPIVSPDSSLILTTPYDLTTPWNYQGFMMWEHYDSNIHFRWKFVLERLIPWRTCWLDNQTILCELISFYPEEKYYYCTITIKPYQKK